MAEKRNGEKEEYAAQEVGRIYSHFRGIAKVYGLAGAAIGERLTFEKSGLSGLVVGFDRDFLDVLIFGDFTKISGDETAVRTGEQFTVPVGEAYIGRVVNALGEPIDGRGSLIPSARSEVEREAPGVVEREPVREPLLTGTKLIDALLPIGRGQRELILGDRKTGKSSIAIDAVINQKSARRRLYCVYCLVGQKESVNAETIGALEKEGALLYTTIVVASASSSMNEQYLAPYVATAIAEFFRDRGEDALIVYDDLTKHAWIWRQISLLLKRPPGREAYPGDIFYLHSRLLERAAKLNADKGSGSLTALPIVETQEGDIAAFIPTNLISITDGQIYLDAGLFQAGFLPAINIGLSVSRIGSQAQPKALAEVTRGLRVLLAQHAELKRLSEIEATFSEESRRRLKRGDVVLEILKQDKRAPISLARQIATFYLATGGYFDDLPIEKVSVVEEIIHGYLGGTYKFAEEEISKKGLTDKAKKALQEIAKKSTEEAA